MNLQPKHVGLSALIILGLILSVAMLSYSYYTNESFGFPLDDPWIHLQFAKNLADYGSFSYYQDELVTSGSTAPLYTLFLAAGFLITNDEMMLSYVLGIVFLLLSVGYFFRIVETMIPGKPLFAFLGTALLLLEPRLQWAALSGMETTLFLLLLLAVTYHWMKGEPVQTGIASGLLLWTRPEAMVLFIALGLDALRHIIFTNREERQRPFVQPWQVKSAIIVAVFGVGYIIFNYLLSGSLLPNTYAAKLAYYSSGGKDFPLQVFEWLTGGHMIIFSVFAVSGIVFFLVSLLRRHETMLTIPVLFSVGMFFAYWIKLPYLYQNGRYLMPILPFLLLTGLAGLDWLVTLAAERLRLGAGTKRIVQISIASYLGIHFFVGFWQGRVMYQDYCKYISDRQVRTAHWIKKNLPGDAVVATHDVGALAFYSGRRIVDMVGLISPEMIERIGDLGRMKAFLVENKVTHLALLRNWFEVVNIRPMFQTNEQTPEIMEVFEFRPEEVHFTSSLVGHLTDLGWQYIMRGDAQNGGPLIERAVKLDSLSSRAHHHLGWALTMIGEFDRAEEEFRTALQLHPEYWTARYALGQVSIRRGQFPEAVKRFEAIVSENPAMFPAYQSLAHAYTQLGDTVRARRTLESLRIQEDRLMRP